MAEPLRHRQTKGAATDMPGLPPTRHIPTLPEADLHQQARNSPEAPPPNMGAPGGIAHARGLGYHWPIQPGASPGHVQGDAVMADFTLPDGLHERRSERAAGYMCKGDELDGST